MIACGAAIRRMTREVDPVAGRAAPTDHPPPVAFANRLVRYLHEALRDEAGQRAFALVRIFETRRFDQLSADLQACVRGMDPGTGPDTRCLTLLATAGDRPEWNEVSRSTGHRAIPLPSVEALERLPMISQLIRQLGFEVGGILRPTDDILLRAAQGVFHVVEARGSPYIPAQRAFVEPCGIRSVVGFGDALADGRVFAVIMFSKAPIPRETAQLLSHLDHSTRTALLSFADVPNRIAAQHASLNRLLANHEAIVIDQERRLRSALADLTRANAELRRSNEELVRFADIASHDLHAPLRNVETLAGWVEEEAESSLPPAGRDHLATLRRRVRDMQRLLEDLLLYARAGRRESEARPVDMNALVREIADLVGPPPGFSVVAQENLPTIVTPQAAIRRVLKNLIENALKHHDRARGRIEISCRSRGGFLEFTVLDDGPGIPAADHRRVMEILKTGGDPAPGRGGGMGLAIVRRTVESHGGAVRILPGEGRGTAIRFTWPRAPEPA